MLSKYTGQSVIIMKHQLRGAKTFVVLQQFGISIPHPLPWTQGYIMFHRHSPYGKLIKRGGHPVSGFQLRPSNKSCPVVYQTYRNNNTFEHFRFWLNRVTMTTLSPLAVSQDSDTASGYESPQSDVVRTFFRSLYILCISSHDVSPSRHWRHHKMATQPVITKDIMLLYR